ncbi:MAG: metallophosphoesterase family protein [Methylococcaceae bacterium]|jgi:predicted phosphodiesterase
MNLNPPEIDIVSTDTDHHHDNIEQITRLLRNEPVSLNRSGHFMGRPGTQLYLGDKVLVKLRSELRLNYQRMREWVQHKVALEANLNIYHPEKCWFILAVGDGDYVAGNLCPLLTPLHVLLDDGQACDRAQRIFHLKKLYQIYFQVASRHGKRLDEGLSNFGVDHQQTLYYLDDDIYAWDNFLSFSHLLGVLVRNNAWFDESTAEALGSYIHILLSEHFLDKATCTFVGKRLHDIYLPDPSKKSIFNKVISNIQPNNGINQHKVLQQRYMAILSDVHANLPALDAVLAYLQQKHIDQGIVIGDTVGYGAFPVECIERLQRTDFAIIKGNHDHAAVSGESQRGMSTTATWCINWTVPRLSPEHLKWLDDLPLALSGQFDSGRQWVAMHGSPIDPHYFYGYVYAMTYESNLEVLKKRGIDWCFHGHSHIQGIYALKNRDDQNHFHIQQQQDLQLYQQCLICPGSVGQPRNGDARAQFAILDQLKQSITFYAIDYPKEKMILRMQAEGFPKALSTRLETGN